MWNPIKIEIENLFAHKDSVYEFEQNKCVVIFGKNNTDKNLENNGAGKTTLFEAVCIALTNESLRAIKKDSFINIEEEECKIVFHLFNPVLKKKLVISRQFFRNNKPVKIEVWENDILNNQLTSVNETNKYIGELIGISREDLLRYFIISQDNNYTFFTASDGEKKEIMNRITSADIVEPLIEELVLRLKETEISATEVTNELNKQQDRIVLFEEQIIEIDEDSDISEELSEYDRKILSGLDDIKKLVLEDKELGLELKAKIKEESTIEVEDTAELKEKKLKLQGERDNIDVKIYDNEKIEKKLKLELEETITCPSCSHEFINESDLHLSVEEVRGLLEEVRVEIKKQNKSLNKKKLEIVEVKEQIEEADENKTLLKKVENDISDLKREIKNTNQDILIKEKRVKELRQEKHELIESKKDNKLRAGVEAKIKEAKEEVKLLNKKLAPLNDELERIKFWQFNMGRSGFQTYLANKAIKILEGSTNYFLKKMKIDYRVAIEPFRILKSGSVREKIDCFISTNGIDSKNFLAYSGGERQRVTLAGILAIQKLINLSLDGKGLNMLLLDESLGNIDTMGTMEIVKILGELGITVLLITQNIEDSSIFSNSIKVVKDEGVSHFILE